MTQAQILAAVKLACRIFSNALDDEFNQLIDSAYYDLEISGIADTEGNPYTYETTDQLVLTAVKTYVKLNFGDLISGNSSSGANMWSQLNDCYFNQKALLKMRVHSNSKYEGGDES